MRAHIYLAPAQRNALENNYKNKTINRYELRIPRWGELNFDFEGDGGCGLLKKPEENGLDLGTVTDKIWKREQASPSWVRECFAVVGSQESSHGRKSWDIELGNSVYVTPWFFP